MYTTVRDPVAKGTAEAGTRRVAPTVLLLGATSLLTDVSSEMVAAVLPVYLTLHLGLSPLLFGIVDGLYQGVTAVVRLAAGHVSDRTRRPKVVAAAGYGLSAVMKLALLPATSFAALTAVIALDRTGKGIRTAPRDAMIAAATPGSSVGFAFGVHRAMDTAGAMTGPLLAFALLALLPGGYDSVFVVSAGFAVLGVAVLLLLVRDPIAADRRPAAPRVPVRVRDSVVLVRDRGVARTMLAAGLLALLTVSDAFLYLSLQDRHDLPPAYVPLLFVLTSAVYLLLAVPVGRLADRAGRLRVFLAGHVLLLVAYAVVLGASGEALAVAVSLAALGAYYAATDGVLAAATSRLVPASLRSSGLAAVHTVVAVGKLGSAVVFGAVWTAFGRDTALVAFTVALFAGVLVAARLLRGFAAAAGEGTR